MLFDVEIIRPLLLKLSIRWREAVCSNRTWTGEACQALPGWIDSRDTMHRSIWCAVSDECCSAGFVKKSTNFANNVSTTQMASLRSEIAAPHVCDSDLLCTFLSDDSDLADQRGIAVYA